MSDKENGENDQHSKMREAAERRRQQVLMKKHGNKPQKLSAPETKLSDIIKIFSAKDGKRGKRVEIPADALAEMEAYYNESGMKEQVEEHFRKGGKPVGVEFTPEYIQSRIEHFEAAEKMNQTFSAKMSSLPNSGLKNQAPIGNPNLSNYWVTTPTPPNQKDSNPEKTGKIFQSSRTVLFSAANNSKPEKIGFLNEGPLVFSPRKSEKTEAKTEELEVSEKLSVLFKTSTSIGETTPINIPNPKDLSSKSLKNVEKIVKTLEAPRKSLKGTPKLEAVKPSPTESKLCEKCTRNGQNLLEAQAELKTAVAKADKYEEKAKKSSKLEKDLKALRKEMEQLKLQNQLLSDRNAILEQEKVAGNGKEEKLKKDVEGLEEQFKREQQRVATGHQEIEGLNRRIDTIQLKFALKLSHIEEELVKKDTIVRGLRRTQLKKSGPPTPSEQPTSPESSESLTPSSQNAPKMSLRDHLMKWWKLKDDFENDLVLKEHRNMIERLISITQDRETKRIAEYELTRFKGIMKIYMEIVGMNIQKIKKTDDVTNMFPLPEYPKLSQKFVEEFKKEMENQPETDLSPFTNCYICFEPYVDGDKKEYCKGCGKPVHAECEANWKKAQKDLNTKEETCGFCREKKDNEERKRTAK